MKQTPNKQKTNNKIKRRKKHSLREGKIKNREEKKTKTLIRILK